MDEDTVPTYYSYFYDTLETMSNRYVSMNYENTSYYYDDLEPIPGEEMDEPDSMRNIAVAMLVFLSVAGINGNFLVLYVFTRQKQQLSSTVFILTLAGTDLVTSLVTMPFTIALELLNYTVEYDAVCKVYQFLATTTIPFSASVMVAIAVDRYFCIVHPFKHTMTLRRAKFLVFGLALFSVCLGIPSALMYGIYKVMGADRIRDVLQYFRNNSGHGYSVTNGSIPLGSVSLNISAAEYDQAIDYDNDEYTDNFSETILRNTGRCHRNELIVGKTFFDVYQKIYSSYYAICAVIVIVLYIIIYRSVQTRRRRRLHLTMANSCCGFLANQGQQNVGEHNENNDHEQTDCTMLNNVRDKSPGGHSKQSKEEGFRPDVMELEDKNGNGRTSTDNNADQTRDALVKTMNGVSRAKLEKLRMANIKTALCLSVVALTYIVAFLPAWLMALRLIPMNPIIFFMYFTYNVANPIIYAFLNQSFRNHLKTIFKCWK